MRGVSKGLVTMIRSYRGKTPAIDPTVYVDPGAQVIGDVVIGEDSSIWCNAVVRGDVNIIRIGARTNVQDLAMLHVTRRTASLHIGDDVTIGHAAILHGCTVHNRCLIGMGAIVMDGAVVGEESIIGAGALVTEGAVIPPRSLAVGAPAVVKRSLRPEEIAFLVQSAANYVQDAKDYWAEASNSQR
jgi:carbonic anhydrase/acetyltransferase-like protein (isoleucine patch superfamily)